jgi:hypothetical protein
MSKPKSYRLEEISGNQFSSLTGAQQAAAGMLADMLTDTVREMFHSGVLTVENGLIVPNRNHPKE